MSEMCPECGKAELQDLSTYDADDYTYWYWGCPECGYGFPDDEELGFE